MPKILTPLSLWNNFDTSLPVYPVKLLGNVNDGVKIERVNFSGRDTGSGRVQIAAAFAYDVQSPAPETVIIFPDSTDTIDEEVLKLFVQRGYSALMIDYRGEWPGCSFFTRYPENISYANTAKCGRRKDYVDDGADKTSWYEWVGIGLYAKKYVVERTGCEKIAVVGLRDGGEIAWKLAVADQFSCVIPVCAAGWKSYAGISKYVAEEPALDEERYRFIAGIDSQAYAPYVRCPVLMLCSTNDPLFDYDRAYDTFSRINPEFIDESAIAYSIMCNESIGASSTRDMFLILDKNLKKRSVYIPKPPEIAVGQDEESNLTAKACVDGRGVVETCQLYLAEDCIDSSLREWGKCPEMVKTEDNVFGFYLNVYEKTSTIFVLCRVSYINGFTVWSKIAVKKVSGSFRNSKTKRRVMYTDKNGPDGFSVADAKVNAVGGIFFPNAAVMPQLVTKAKGVRGLYSEYGLTTFRMGNPQFSPNANSLLYMDVFCDETAVVTLTFTELTSGEAYVGTANVVGGVWQGKLFESKNFKTAGGVPLGAFSGELKLTITCPTGYAVNNIIWL